MIIIIALQITVRHTSIVPGFINNSIFNSVYYPNDIPSFGQLKLLAKMKFRRYATLPIA
ncbi:unnamed protein product [Brugia timori]|uniref:Uncharacterized protein n=1 Tax=Brugia timori TaxID=42155 RepID=A0A3P7UV90_9BILA|nr:unnamed protein product [Brugia timori]